MAISGSSSIIFYLVSPDANGIQLIGLRKCKNCLVKRWILSESQELRFNSSCSAKGHLRAPDYFKNA